MKKVVVCLILFLWFQDASAQWTQTGGPVAARSWGIVQIDGVIFINGGFGVYRSADKGINWSLVKSGLPPDLLIHQLKTSNGKLYLATDKGVYYSADSGDTWLILSSHKSNAIAVDGNKICYQRNFDELYYSNDHGATWTLEHSLTPISHLHIHNDKLWIFTNRFYTSDDLGTTWNLVDAEFSVAHFGYSNGVVMVSGAIAPLGSQSRLSFDDGQSWSILVDAEYSDVFWNGSEIFLVNSREMIYSGDNGATWTTRTFPQGIPEFNAYVTGYGKETYIAYGNGFLFSDNDGSTFQKRSNGLKNHQGLAVQTTGDLVIARGGNNGVYISDDDGDSWREGIQRTEFAYVTYTFHGSKNTVYVSDQLNLYRSANAGASWETIPLTQPSGGFLAMDGHGDSLIVISNNRVFTSLNGGDNWTEKSTSSIGLSGPYNIFVFGDTAMLVGAITVDGGGNEIFFSDDFGSTWQKKKNMLFLAGVNDFFLGESVWLAATTRGLYRSDDHGQSWNVVDCVPASIVYDIQPVGNALFIATDSGVYGTRDLGRTWEDRNDGLVQGSIYSITTNSEFTFAGTFGESVWRIPTVQLLNIAEPPALVDPVVSLNCGRLTITNYTAGTISWYRNDMLIQEGGTDCPVSGNGDYKVVVTFGCEALSSVIVEVRALSLEKSCNALRLVNYIKGDIRWFGPLGILNGESEEMIQVAEPGEYYAVVEDDCEVMTSSVVTVVPLDLGVPVPEVEQICNFLEVTNHQEGLEIRWIRDGELFAHNVKSITLTEPGTYAVIYNSNCHGASTGSWTRSEAGSSSLYNVLTLNGDGRNDTYFLPEDLAKSSISVYNRWGRLIFYSFAYGNDWSPDPDQISPGQYFVNIQSACYGNLNGVLTILEE